MFVGGQSMFVGGGAHRSAPSSAALQFCSSRACSPKVWVPAAEPRCQSGGAPLAGGAHGRAGVSLPGIGQSTKASQDRSESFLSRGQWQRSSATLRETPAMLL